VIAICAGVQLSGNVLGHTASRDADVDRIAPYPEGAFDAIARYDRRAAGAK
jgi:hypothetical protein